MSSVSLDLRSFGIVPEKFKALPEADQAEILTTLSEALEENPLEAYNRPHSPKLHRKQLQFHAAKTRYKLFIAGNRSGKSYAGAADDLIQALPMDWVPEHLQPYKKWGIDEPFKCRIFTPDLTDTMFEIHDALKALCPPSQLKGGSWKNAYARADRILRFENGSQFDFFSYDQDLDKMGSVSRHRIRFDEEPPEAIYKASRKRVIDTGGDLCFTFTPELGISWTHGHFYERRDDPEITVVQAGMADNPHLSPSEIEAYIADIGTEEEKRVALYGEYVAMGGVFYPEFTDRLHVVDPIDRKHLEGQDIVVGIDPGYNTTAVIYVSFDSDNSALVFDEIYAKQSLPDEISRRIHERNKFWGIDPSYVIDPSARNRATVNAEQVESEFARAGIYCQHGQNARGPGIIEVKRRLQHSELVVSRDCSTLRWEFPRYQRKPDSNDEWEAIKVNDHGLDALRYALMTRTWVSAETAVKRPRHSDFTYEGPYKPRRPSEAPPLGAFS